MTKQNNNSKKGFTIIEVVLVLAIAGLIFLMVFVALPALQRSQRDTARRNDISRVSTALTQYKVNNQNNLPGTSTLDSASVTSSFPANCNSTPACSFIRKYMNAADSSENTFKDPDGNFYGVDISALTSGKEKVVNSMNHNIYIVTSAKCNGEKAEYVSNSARFAILYRLEGAGTYCMDGQ